MIKPELDVLVGVICDWFALQVSEGVPSNAMCEAFMMIPLMKWMKTHRFSDMRPEYWDRSAPYHAYDLRAVRDQDEYLFDLKFVGFEKRFAIKVLERDFGFLSRVRPASKFRYSLVSGEARCFADNNQETIDQIQSFLSDDGRKHIVVPPDRIIIARSGGYLTMICSVLPEGLSTEREA
jgi:hypothetical protein